MTSRPGSVLFCCTHNSIRSPMAEGILKYLQGKNIFVDSSGVRPQAIDGARMASMDRIGIGMAKHRSKTFDDLEDSSFDLIISLSPEAQHKAVEMTRTMACDVEFWPTLDPSVIEGSREERLEAYRDVRDKL